MARLQLFMLAVALLGTASGAPLQSILDAASELEPWIIEAQTVSAAQRAAPACMINSPEARELYRSVGQALHKIPELLYDTPLTYKLLEKKLKEIGVKHRCGRGRCRCRCNGSCVSVV